LAVQYARLVAGARRAFPFGKSQCRAFVPTSDRGSTDVSRALSRTRECKTVEAPATPPSVSRAASAALLCLWAPDSSPRVKGRNQIATSSCAVCHSVVTTRPTRLLLLLLMIAQCQEPTWPGILRVASTRPRSGLKKAVLCSEVSSLPAATISGAFFVHVLRYSSIE